jgi:hypothetical protein
MQKYDMIKELPSERRELIIRIVSMLIKMVRK